MLSTIVQIIPDNIEKLSITNSLGVPSEDPSKWQPDIEKCKQYLNQGQILIVSVVGTFEEGQTNDSFVQDFTRCAMLAKEAGADVIELNLSCPNSPSAEGSIYTKPDISREIAQSVKRQIKETPLFVKVGYYENIGVLQQVVRSTAAFIQGIAAINTIKMAVVDPAGQQALPGTGRDKAGICGAAIKKCGLETCRHLVELREKEKYEFVIIGVGGAMTPRDINDYIGTGVNAVQTCTGAMWNPYLAVEYHLDAVNKRVRGKDRAPQIIDYSQEGIPEMIDPGIVERQRRGEVTILFPIWQDIRTCPGCGAKLKDVLHTFRSYRFCARCKDTVSAS